MSQWIHQSALDDTEAWWSEELGRVDDCGLGSGKGDVPACTITCDEIKELPWF